MQHERDVQRKLEDLALAHDRHDNERIARGVPNALRDLILINKARRRRNVRERPSPEPGRPPKPKPGKPPKGPPL